ncbi:uncharacterized protein LOC102480620 [Tupaia chinensis]|uniref:uncharacterized protein LOC102480620 n=1 Tax=Tupaia chinensis TaxID=246437 RepID=UPI0003C92292|nr:uncharacterized protein LOC102480620 [Tupaia chinensis]
MTLLEHPDGTVPETQTLALQSSPPADGSSLGPAGQEDCAEDRPPCSVLDVLSSHQNQLVPVVPVVASRPIPSLRFLPVELEPSGPQAGELWSAQPHGLLGGVAAEILHGLWFWVPIGSGLPSLGDARLGAPTEETPNAFCCIESVERMLYQRAIADSGCEIGGNYSRHQKRGLEGFPEQTGFPQPHLGKQTCKCRNQRRQELGCPSVLSSRT